MRKQRDQPLDKVLQLALAEAAAADGLDLEVALGKLRRLHGVLRRRLHLGRAGPSIGHGCTTLAKKDRF